MPFLSALAGFSLSKTAVVLIAIAALACLDLATRVGDRPTRYSFAVILGTVLSLGLIRAAGALFTVEAQSGHLLALGVLLIIITWRLVFGAWDARTKATVLGTFVFWLLFHMLFAEPVDERIAHILAIVIAVIPALVWCALFLPYHRERLSVVFAMFFAGMLSTVPILFYDAMARQGVDLQFFLFRLQPESFSESARMFVQSEWPALTSVPATVVSMLVSFLIVGLIEEGSKLWVLRRSAEQFSTSVDDVMQLAILVAIGFAFAENITSTGYFLEFVRQYLLGPGGKDWMGFIANIAGRSVLTSMVHIVSTGMAGYFLGRAIFAGPELQEREAQARPPVLASLLHRMTGASKKVIFRIQMIMTGYLLAALLHMTSNFLVSVPDVLPGNPRTFGDLVHAAPGSPLHLIALLLVPTVFYVIGGFWLLTWLFRRKENRRERGHLVLTDTFVSQEAGI
jgi:hypothetical protein